MVFNLNDKTSSTFFINLSETGSDLETKFCQATQNYNTPIIKDASQYYVSIERATIPLHSIKFLQDIKSAISFVDKSNSNVKSYDLIDIFSITDLFSQLNNFKDQNDNKALFYIRQSGRITIKYDHYNTHNIVLSNEIKRILDVENNTLTFPGPTQILTGGSSCLNRIDNLRRIIIVSRDLPCVSELNNKTRLKEITSIDYSPQYTFTTTGGNNKVLEDDYSFSFEARDNLILQPNYSRLLFMSGSQIISINVEAYAEILNLSTLETELIRISLRPGSQFNIKLQFWKKKT